MRHKFFYFVEFPLFELFFSSIGTRDNVKCVSCHKKCWPPAVRVPPLGWRVGEVGNGQDRSYREIVDLKDSSPVTEQQSLQSYVVFHLHSTLLLHVSLHTESTPSWLIKTMTTADSITWALEYKKWEPIREVVMGRKVHVGWPGRLIKLTIRNPNTVQCTLSRILAKYPSW